MYAALWRRLPGPRPLRVVAVVLLALGAVAACFVWVFPVAAPYVPFNQQTVEQEEGP
ncbi:MAG: hypothetical protein ACFCVF_01925 [Kineosporiaceae bacterium]